MSRVDFPPIDIRINGNDRDNCNVWLKVKRLIETMIRADLVMIQWRTTQTEHVRLDVAIGWAQFDELRRLQSSPSKCVDGRFLDPLPLPAP